MVWGRPSVSIAHPEKLRISSNKHVSGRLAAFECFGLVDPEMWCKPLGGNKTVLLTVKHRKALLDPESGGWVSLEEKRAPRSPLPPLREVVATTLVTRDNVTYDQISALQTIRVSGPVSASRMHDSGLQPLFELLQHSGLVWLSSDRRWCLTEKGGLLLDVARVPIEEPPPPASRRASVPLNVEMSLAPRVVSGEQETEQEKWARREARIKMQVMTKLALAPARLAVMLFEHMMDGVWEYEHKQVPEMLERHPLPPEEEKKLRDEVAEQREFIEQIHEFWKEK